MIDLIEPLSEQFDNFTTGVLEEFRRLSEKIDHLEAENKAYLDQILVLVSSIDKKLENKGSSSDSEYLISLKE